MTTASVIAETIAATMKKIGDSTADSQSIIICHYTNALPLRSICFGGRTSGNWNSGEGNAVGKVPWHPSVVLKLKQHGE